MPLSPCNLLVPPTPFGDLHTQFDAPCPLWRCSNQAEKVWCPFLIVATAGLSTPSYASPRLPTLFRTTSLPSPALWNPPWHRGPRNLGPLTCIDTSEALLCHQRRSAYRLPKRTLYASRAPSGYSQLHPTYDPLPSFSRRRCGRGRHFAELPATPPKGEGVSKLGFLYRTRTSRCRHSGSSHQRVDLDLFFFGPEPTSSPVLPCDSSSLTCHVCTSLLPLGQLFSRPCGAPEVHAAPYSAAERLIGNPSFLSFACRSLPPSSFAFFSRPRADGGCARTTNKSPLMRLYLQWKRTSLTSKEPRKSSKTFWSPYPSRVPLLCVHATTSSQSSTFLHYVRRTTSNPTLPVSSPPHSMWQRARS